jgi:hypothetical protein
MEHRHDQVRWNVAAALKSVQVSDSDLERIVGALLQDSSSWVARELLDVSLRSERILRLLGSSRFARRVTELLEKDSVLLDHTILRLGSLDKRDTLARLMPSVSERAAQDFASRHIAGGREFSRFASGGALLREDFLGVEREKARLEGQHGKLYKAAERVISRRMQSPDVELRQLAIMSYLHSTHDALAWASVRALFSGRLDGCDMLTHQSEWIRRECVEETLRMENGRRKYLALRQIEAHRVDLWKVDEIRPYLTEIDLYPLGA